MSMSQEDITRAIDWAAKRTFAGEFVANMYVTGSPEFNAVQAGIQLGNDLRESVMTGMKAVDPANPPEVTT